MAKSPKRKTTKTSKKKIEDAIELDVETSEAETIAEDAEAAIEEAVADETPSAEENNVPDDEDGVADTVSDGASEELAEILDAEIDPVSEEPLVEPQIQPEPTPQKSGGFFSMLLGGVAAGAIGYGIATYFQPDDNSAELAAMIDALNERIDELPVPDTSAVEAQIEGVSEQVNGGLESVSAQLGELEARIETVERQPNADGTLSETALAAYRAELDELQNSLLSTASQAETDLAAARSEAERLEQEAVAAAEAAAARAAINRIATAVETGAPFADALADLDVSDAPVALTDAAETGVATNAQLMADFPAVARAALATARSEGVSDDAAGLGGFLRSQFDVRSTTPQEGAGPDAVLSRAEAAVKEGRVADALAEIEALPEVARAEITDWAAQAQERSDVLDAIATLSETYQ